MTRELAGIPLHEFALVHAAAIEGHGLEDLGAISLGVGKVASAVRAHSLLSEQQRYRAVLLFGVAGAFPQRHRTSEPPVAIGDLAIVQQDVLADEGVATPDGFLDLGAMKLGDCGPFRADPRLASAAAELLNAPLVDGATVSSCSGIDDASQTMCTRTGADVESMEGAAVAFVCRQLELPLLQVRAISNWTGDRDRGDWNLGTAVDSVQAAVRRLMNPDA